MPVRRQSPLDYVSKYLFHRCIIITHSYLNGPEILLLFLAFQMTEIQGRQSCLRRHKDGKHTGNTAVTFPKGMNKYQFCVNNGKCVRHL